MGHRVWGSSAPRRFFSAAHWDEPMRWNDEAEAARRRRRVFCASMADVFERRSELKTERERLWQLIEGTPWLDWLLLTKRPQNIADMVPWRTVWPDNVWLGTTVENQQFAEKRLPFLLRHRARVRFLSCEPLLGPLDLSSWFNRRGLNRIDWVIAGGESGAHSRAMHPDWALNLLHQCQNAGTPFHFKQWGHWAPRERHVAAQVLQFQTERPVRMAPLGKKAAGRMLNGATWNGLPRLAAACG